ncbi:MAG: S41 family peptidase, partial [Thermonemataceae bacterium]
GTEIFTINNREVDSLIRFLVDKIPNDGYGDGWSRYVLERSFRYYYHLFFGQPQYFDLKIRNKDAIEEVVTVPGRLEKERSRILKERYPDKVLPESVISLRYDDETASALLKITRFDNWKIGKKKYKFLKVLKKKMKDILKADVKNVILDVGDRGGGNELWGLELLSYFLAEPYTAYKAVEFKTLDYNISKKYSNTSSIAYGLAKLYLNVDEADSTLNQQNYRGLKPYPPKKKRFTGNLYLLVGGATASATSDFAAWMDALALATIIGTETGGSYLGNTSNWEFLITLPNTKLRLQLPLARYLTNVENTGLGRGVIPAYVVPTTLHDKLNDIDTQLNFTLQLIREKAN